MAGFISCEVKVDMSGINKYQLRMAKLCAKSSHNDPLLDELDLRWIQRVRLFLAEHFEHSSKGGTDWAPHAQSTIDARRRKLDRLIEEINDSSVPWAQQKAAAKRSAHNRSSRARVAKGGSEFLILDETHVLKEAVCTPNPNQSVIQEPTPLLADGLVLAGDTTHGDNDFSTAQLAIWHQNGTPRMPARPIIVPLDDACVEDMRRDLVDIVLRICEDCAIKMIV